MENKLVDNVYTMIKKWDESHFGYNGPEIVMICSPTYYFEKLRGNESDTYKDLKIDSYITLANLYPELKSNELVQQQINLYLDNNKKIISLNEKKINKKIYAWWLYFGK